jgi:hypothetical protein
MSLPKPMASPRQQIHKAFCATQFECKYQGASDRSLWCTLLDQLLDFNDEMVLHAKAHELMAEAEKLRMSGKRVPQYLVDHRAGAAVLIDPYEKQHAHDPDKFPDDCHPGELRPDCPNCVAGKEHYHRKSDDSPVRMPDVPRETSGDSDASA